MTCLIMPNKKTTKPHKAVGTILITLSFLTLLHHLYPVFFERKNYYNRKALLKWLLTNKLPQPTNVDGSHVWIFQNYMLIKTQDKHFLTHDSEICICGAILSPTDRKRYNQIDQILTGAINGNT